MPRKRKVETRSPRSKITIFCEGKCTEPKYLAGAVKHFKVQRGLVAVEQTRVNTAKELVKQAKAARESPLDEVWVMVDRDGYTKHPHAFDEARANDVRIAFSSVAFEFWVLLHFEYTTRQFPKAADVIAHLNEKNHLGEKYSKVTDTLFESLVDRLDTARTNAERVRRHHDGANQGTPIYDLDPYTNVDELVDRIAALGKPHEAPRA